MVAVADLAGRALPVDELAREVLRSSYHFFRDPRLTIPSGQPRSSRSTPRADRAAPPRSRPAKASTRPPRQAPPPATGAPPRPPSPDRLRRRDRRRSRRRAPPSIHAPRARDRLARSIRAHRGGGSAAIVARGQFTLR